MLFNTIAQIITRPSMCQSAGIQLYFSAAASDVLVFITTLDESNKPANVIAETRVALADIKIGQATTVKWEKPVLLSPATGYAYCIGSADGSTALQVAQVGEVDRAGGAVAGLQTGVGQLLRINTSGIATVFENRMLRFELLDVQYTQQSKTVVLGTKPVENATAFVVNAGATQPEATARASYTIELVGADGKLVQAYEVDAGQAVRLGTPFTGNVRVSAILRVGVAGLGAVLEPGTMLLVGTLLPTGTYISPAITTNGGDDLRVIYAGEIPAGASVAAHVQMDGAGPWRQVPFDSSSNAAGVIEVSHRLQAIAGAKARLRLTLSGGTNARPKVRNLRAAVLG